MAWILFLRDNISTVEWPPCGEIDIKEYIGKEPHNIYCSINGPGYDKTNTYTDHRGYSNNFHTFTLNWQPDLLSLYVDGNIYNTINNSQAGGKSWPFNKKFFIILNCAVGGN